jgi:hypothetical protein
MSTRVSHTVDAARIGRESTIRACRNGHPPSRTSESHSPCTSRVQTEELLDGRLHGAICGKEEVRGRVSG